MKDNPDPSCNIKYAITRRCPVPVWLPGLVLQLDVSIKVSVKKKRDFEGQQQQKDSVVMICVPYVFNVSELVYKALFPSWRPFFSFCRFQLTPTVLQSNPLIHLPLKKHGTNTGYWPESALDRHEVKEEMVWCSAKSFQQYYYQVPLATTSLLFLFIFTVIPVFLCFSVYFTTAFFPFN